MINWIRNQFNKRKQSKIPFQYRIQQEIRDARDNVPALNNELAKCMSSERLKANHIINALDEKNVDIETLFKENKHLFDIWKLFIIQSQLGLMFKNYYMAQLHKLTQDSMNYLSTYNHSENLTADFKNNYDDYLANQIWKIEPDIHKTFKELYLAADELLHKNEDHKIINFFDRFFIPKENYQWILELGLLPSNELLQMELENIRAREEEYKKRREEAAASEMQERNSQSLPANETVSQENIEKSSTPSQKEISSERDVVFISYSRKDKRWLKILRTYLKPYERQGIKVWDDTQIDYGTLWKPQIEKALKTARVAILLISPDFLASDFIINEELPPLLSAAQNDGAIIIPLIVRHSAFTNTESISKYQAFNQPEKPLANLSVAKREETFAQLTENILKVMTKDQ